MINLYNEGAKRRRTAETMMNKNSSRSHSILRINMSRKDQTGTMLSSILNLIDLAGSERITRSKVEGAGLVEANNINKSLMTLGKVINALAVMSEKNHSNNNTIDMEKTKNKTKAKSPEKISSPSSTTGSYNNNNNNKTGFNGKFSGTIHIPYRDSKLTRLLQNSYLEIHLFLL